MKVLKRGTFIEKKTVFSRKKKNHFKSKEKKCLMSKAHKKVIFPKKVFSDKSLVFPAKDLKNYAACVILAKVIQNKLGKYFFFETQFLKSGLCKKLCW